MIFLGSNIVSQIVQHFQKMENVALLCDKPWIAINESEDHELYIFNQDNTYLYVRNGVVKYSTWKYILANHTIIIKDRDIDYMLHVRIIEDKYLILQMDGMTDFALLVNENKCSLNSLTQVELDLQKLSKMEEKNKSTEDSILSSPVSDVFLNLPDGYC